MTVRVIKKRPKLTKRKAVFLIKVESGSAFVHMLLVRICSYLKSIMRYNFLNFVYACTATIPITSYNDICNRSQHCNFGEAQAESSLMMVYVNQNMLEQL